MVAGSTFQGNTGNGGAAISAPDVSTVLVDSSAFIGNHAGYGHAIFKAGGSLTLNNSRFEQNGSAANGFGTVDYSGDFDIWVRGCQFIENQAYQGGALHDAGGGGTVWIENSQFIDNAASYAAGVIRSGGGRGLQISHSTFIENATLEQGGVINSYAPMTITASTFYSNTANMGGVIFTHSDATGPIPNSDTPEAESDADPLVWRNQTIGAHSYNEYQFEVTVLPNAGGQRIVNSACVQQANLTLRCTASVVPPAPGGGDDGGSTIPQLFFGKVAQDLNGLPLTVEDVIRYTLLITNPHQVSVSGIIVTDSIPAHTAYIPNSDTPEAVADTDPLVWRDLLIAPGVTTLTFEVTVNPQTYGEVIRNQACLHQAGLTQTCTPRIEPPGNGIVKHVMYLPSVFNNSAPPALKRIPNRLR